jgi:hypothetical protein
MRRQLFTSAVLACLAAALSAQTAGEEDPRLPMAIPTSTATGKACGTRPLSATSGKICPVSLPLTPAGEAALQHNLTKTIDPESLCMPGGIPRHNASGLPFEIAHAESDRVPALLQLLSPHPRRRHPQAQRRSGPTFFGEELGRWEGDTPSSIPSASTSRSGSTRTPIRTATRFTSSSADAARLRPHPRRHAD